MRYELLWTDSAMVEHYKTQKALKGVYADLGIQLTVMDNDGEWFDFACRYEFEAADDAEAIAFAKTYDFGGGTVNGTGVFTLLGTETHLYWTEENWNAERA